MDYATQDYKTERQHYVSGINCAPEIARDEMQMVKQQYGKEGGIIAFHGYQSFAPGEVTPEQAHEIGVELARRLWGDRFQIVVATHLDREHIHNHFVLNSVSFVDGKKYNDCKATYALMRQTSDRLCREHGLSVIENPEQGRTMSRDTWEAEQKGKPTWYSQIRADVDSCITRSFLFEHFITNLKKQGYEVKTGKYIALRPPGRERFVRLKTLGDNYTEQAIRRRIRDHERTPLYRWFRSPPKSCYKFKSRPKKLTGFRALSYRVPRWANSKSPQLFRKTAVQSGRGHYVGTLCCAGQTTDEVQGGHLGSIFILNRTLQGKMDALADQRKTLYCQKLRYPQNAPLSAFNPFKRTGRSYGYTPGLK